MDGAEAAFARKLGDAAALARDLRFGACSASFRRLGAAAAASGSKHGAFVAGVLEGAFSGLGSLFSRRGISPRDRADAAARTGESLSRLSSACRDGDRAGVYAILEDLSFEAARLRLRYAGADPPGLPESARECIEVLEASMGRPADPGITARDLDSMLAGCVDGGGRFRGVDQIRPRRLVIWRLFFRTAVRRGPLSRRSRLPRQRRNRAYGARLRPLTCPPCSHRAAPAGHPARGGAQPAGQPPNTRPRRRADPRRGRKSPG